MVVFTAFAVGGSLLITPLLMLFLSIIFMASLGKSLGVRRFYVALLLKVFEYGRQNIESAKNQTRINFNISGSSESGDYAPSVNNSAAPISSSSSQHSQSTPCIPCSVDNKPLANGQHHSHHHQHTYSNGGNTVISRDALILLPEGEINGGHHSDPHHQHHHHHHQQQQQLQQQQSKEAASAVSNSAADKVEATEQHFEFHLANCLDYVKTGVEAIIEDDVTSRFEAEELKNWNLLTRTNRYYEFISWRLSVIWVCGFVVRYAVLMPVRVLTCFLGVLWLTFCTAMVGCVAEGETKRWMVQKVSIQCFGLLGSALSSVVNYHNPENRPGASGICVANHTSPIDVLMLMQDNCYSLIGQSHGGFLGILQRALARASPHIWFERAESKDRLAVAQRLRSHVSDPNNPPILIFPEGTCINNTSVMQFKKGSFEVGGVIYPVAIKYDPRFGDPFWNSSKYSMVQHLLLMMTSWAIVCDVWYLPPMYRQPDESAIVFANRVKSVIAEQGGLIDLVWDGNLKRNKPKEEWKEKQQEEFTKRLKTD